MHWLFDAFLIAIFLVFLIFNAQRGLVRAVFGSAKCTVSILLSLTLGKALGYVFYEIFIHKLVTGTVYTAIEPMMGGFGTDHNIFSVLGRHGELASVLSRFGITPETLAAKYGEVTNATRDTVYEMAEYIASPIADTVSTVLGIVAIFIVSILVLPAFAKVADLFAKIPVIESLNSFFGAVFGAVSGFIYIWIACLVFGIFVEYRIAEQTAGDIVMMAKNSYLFNFFCNFSPIDFVNVGL